MDFTAKEVNGQIIIDAIVEKINNSVVVHVPDLQTIGRLKREFKEKKEKNK